MKLKSFGCSFIFGSELHDDGYGGPHATPSQHTWPALLAKDLGYDYQCYARPGSGNLRILNEVLNNTNLRMVVIFSNIDHSRISNVHVSFPKEEWPHHIDLLDDYNNDSLLHNKTPWMLLEYENDPCLLLLLLDLPFE